MGRVDARVDMVANFFAYGTLMCADILSAVTGCRLRGTSASLRDYRRHAVRGTDYPGIVAYTGASVSGLLYRDLTAKAWLCLDRFEGEMYVRRQVTVELGHAVTEQAETYMVKAAYVSRLEARGRGFETFLVKAKGSRKNNFPFLGVETPAW